MDVAQVAEHFQRATAEIGKVLVGQPELVEATLIALFCEGHVLIEGVPGLGKTLLVNTLSRVLACRFKRVQFTPDLMPSDLTGNSVYDMSERRFHFSAGPVFTNLLLADEINRAPAKVQSALLEAMQERQVTIGDETFPLPTPFLVLATQNPIEQEGTYPLPEAQVDRFMLKLSVGYPSREEERQILDRMALTNPDTRVAPVTSVAEIVRMRGLVDGIYLDDKVKEYVIDLVMATREPQTFKLDLGPYIQYGASPRATLYLTLAAKAHAFINGRGYVTPQDVKSIGADVLRHRVTISYEAEAEELTSDAIIQRIFDGVPVP
jgi:MoxR-like ATPase